MKRIYKKVRVHYPVQRPGLKRQPKKTSEEVRKIRDLATSVVNEISGFSPLEKKIVSLIEVKNINKARKILGKRLGSHRRALVKVNKLTKAIMEE